MVPSARAFQLSLDGVISRTNCVCPIILTWSGLNSRVVLKPGWKQTNWNLPQKLDVDICRNVSQKLDFGSLLGVSRCIRFLLPRVVSFNKNRGWFLIGPHRSPWTEDRSPRSTAPHPINDSHRTRMINFKTRVINLVDEVGYPQIVRIYCNRHNLNEQPTPPWGVVIRGWHS